ncbi:methicillin resistance protein [Ktedonobacter sp. SOSP1-85]|uniref:lipid II:glycine glycyltransferase FemX n=1 Tax=Ktedonobacter sp. SOSP1-85 TaxID=2778367 RepID=UPI0019152918|nr:peptidoglycan bridge formation glycyltransferase FemA/FemB family protein [Ktedonobacter sp. SOSP1-85]GHO74622.1 methicillin resistance protein [Ktedonobacter sp. SOSP1-85]
MEARIITDRQQWNDFIASSPCCNITQSYEWGELPLLGVQEVLRVGVLDDSGKLCAGMMVLVSRAPVIRQVYLYSPRGPVITDPQSPAMTVLLNFVRAEARKRGAFMLKVEPSVDTDNREWQTAMQRFGFRTNPHHMHIRHEWVLDISPDEKGILSGMKEKWRYNIRLAGRKGITVRRGETEADLEKFYSIYEVTSERDSFFINSKEFYRQYLDLYKEGDRVALFLAEYEGKPIAGTIISVLGEWSWYMYGASSNEQRNLMPNHLLQWTSMQWAKSKGAKYYNFRGIPDVLEEGQELWGVYQFKRGFGGYPIRFFPTQDLIYNPIVYQAYRALLDFKHWRDERQFKKAAAESAREREPQKPEEKTPVQA